MIRFWSCLRIKITILIPAFNEEKTISEVLEQIYLLNLKHEMEVLLVDDGSTDMTIKKAQRFSKTKIIKHTRNMGKGAAIRTGLKYATGDILVIQDADQEYFPKDIPKLIKPIIEGDVDVVYGSRFSDYPNGMSFSHFFGNILLSLFTRMLYKTELRDMMTGYKIFSKVVYKNLNIVNNGFRFEPEVSSKILSMKKRITEVPIEYKYRRKGKSKISWKDGIKSLIYLFMYKFSIKKQYY